MKLSIRVVSTLLLCASIGFPAPAPSFVQEQTPANHAVSAEAAVLLRLAEFVEWPALPSTPAPRTFNFCIVGQDPFGPSLDETVLGRSVGDRPTMVVRGSRLGDMGRCDVVFVSSSELRRLPKILRQVRNRQILTVSQTANFAASGGIIQLEAEGDHVGFAINTDAAKRAGLTIRAPLLALARIVHDEEATRED